MNIKLDIFTKNFRSSINIRFFLWYCNSYYEHITVVYSIYIFVDFPLRYSLYVSLPRFLIRTMPDSIMYLLLFFLFLIYLKALMVIIIASVFYYIDYIIINHCSRKENSNVPFMYDGIPFILPH